MIDCHFPPLALFFKSQQVELISKSGLAKIYQSLRHLATERFFTLSLIQPPVSKWLVKGTWRQDDLRNFI